ncbi:M13 family metallopeptidase [Weeksellaceae bacterium TAE3-ERU29]|nr:M13 family metallopeptidase [Weeksellaceae bacterium TAE3-ERU29]
MKKIILSLISIAVLSGCNKSKTEQTGKEISVLDIDNMDKSVRPQDDFYTFVNGKWMEKTEVPADRGRWGSFDELGEYTDSVSLKILKESISQKHEPGSDGQKVADLYQSIMDTIARDKAGLSPIQDKLNRIDNINSLDDVTKYLADVTPENDNALFGFGVSPDMKNSDVNAVYLSGPSLGMNRDYYQKDDAESKQKLEAYRKYLVRLFTFMKDETPEESANAVLNLENKMAKNMLTFEELREDDKQYNPVQTSDLSKYVKNVDLQSFLKNQKVNVNKVIIPEFNYYKNLDNFYNQGNLLALKKYLKANLVNGSTSYLSTDLDKLSFDFYSKELNGVDKMRDRDKRALSTINNSIGEAFGKLYVKEVFPPEAKQQAEEMINYLKKSYKNHIENATWMTEETKKKALEKLSKFNVKIGYPDKWKDYSAITIKNTKDGGSFYDNMQAISRWDFNKDLEKIGKPVDKTEWFMAPQTVNAYYSPTFNEIVFPAAIMQPPFFNFKADAAVNFGGMGAVIGHEISHGFDDSGAKYDGDGNLNDWWTPEDQQKFEKLGKSLANQYSKYEPFEGINVNGEATLGENIADLGGVNVSYDALQLYLKDHGNPGLIDGFTPNQRFFISWATIWRTKSKDEALKNQIKTDFHAPGYYRAFGPLENVQGFYDAFNVQPGDKMYKAPEDRIVIW